uniref:SFRICE_029297 n=1 Tax=Spodoptera frugiperda TaxID=7108 RepID=A0A2H1WUK9_SPOFR
MFVNAPTIQEKILMWDNVFKTENITLLYTTLQLAAYVGSHKSNIKISLRREMNCPANSYYEHYCQPVSGHVTIQTDFCTTFGWLAGVYAYYEPYFDVSILMLVVKLRLSKQFNKSALLAA